ncbi:MAG TPA: VOC family protein [Chthoniobacterales bacterium]
MNLEAIDHVALAVRDVERSAQWYIDVLGFERLHEDVWEIPVVVGKNDAAIALFPLRERKPQPSSPPPPIRVLHFAFRTSRTDFLNAQEDLRNHKIQFEFQDHKFSHSIYFDDPDGHEIEITTYELGEAVES